MVHTLGTYVCTAQLSVANALDKEMPRRAIADVLTA